MTDFALPIPPEVLPGVELRRLALERQNLLANLDEQSWPERTNRQARIREIDRLLSADASGRARLESAAQQRNPAGGRACRCGPKQLRNIAPLRNRIMNLEAAEKRQAHELAAYRKQVRAAGFSVAAEPQQPEYLEPRAYWR